MTRSHLYLLDAMRQAALEALLHVDAATDPDPKARHLKHLLAEQAPPLCTAIGALMAMRALARMSATSVEDLLTLGALDPGTPQNAARGYALLQQLFMDDPSAEGLLHEQHRSEHLRICARQALQHQIVATAELRGTTPRVVLGTARSTVLSARLHGDLRRPTIVFAMVRGHSLHRDVEPRDTTERP
ncbi:hypothetical protein [Brachybacterium paraconglomeratum]|uniref:hypothetical protein n=1 Tax=Brachybacterium paraconglomeratum TaxID=173362 RepID=UPI0022AE65F4|nr:hypothetical protein [Brachybacterium paraconglomeratum]MCZ4326741.1 hypothetical protein [Brachybacterium paraconglomeratum]